MNIKQYIYPLMFLILNFLNVSDAYGTLEGEWRYISSFNPNTTIAGTPNPNHVRRVIYGEKYAYFLVHGRAYLHPSIGGQSWGTHGIPAAVLFRTDNTCQLTPGISPEIEAVADLPGIGGEVVNNIEYNLDLGCLAIAYKDGTVTLLYDDGDIKNILSFKEMPLPVRKEIRNITFDTDNRRIYFAGTFGFFIVDAERAELTDLCMSQVPLDYAFRSGDSMIAIGKSDIRNDGSRDNAIAGDIYEAPYNEGISEWGSFKVLEVDEVVSLFANSANENEIAAAKAELFADGKVTGTVWGSPFNENTFGIFCSTTQNRKVAVLQRQGNGKWGFMYVMDLSLPYEKTYAFQISPFEGYHSVTETGFGMQSGKNYWMVDRSKSPDFSASDPIATYISEAWVHKRLDPAESGQSYDSRHIGTLDGKTMWVYEPYKGFKKCRDSAGDGKWSDVSGIGVPNSPAVGVTDNMNWDPVNGLIIRQFGNSYYAHYDPLNLNERDHMAIRKNGVWRDYSMQKVSPDVCAGFADPIGAVVDPEHPEYIYCGSRFFGIMRRNLQDPTDVMFLGVPGQGSKNADLPGFVPVFPEQPLWKGICMVYSLEFDAEGNLWIAYSDFSNQNLILYKWERAAIDASLNAHLNPDSFVGMKHWSLDIPDINNKLDYFPLNHESNHGLGLLSTGNLNVLHIIENREDGGEPILHKIETAYTESGDELRVYGCYDLYEHPETGEVWCCTGSGLLCFKPSEVIDGTAKFRLVNPKVKNAVDCTSNPFDGCTSYYIKADEKGRMWITSKGNGLFCLSPDGNEIMAHFNKSNSLLTDDNLMGICWDGDTHSMIVATYDGFYEFTPYESMEPDRVREVRVWPSAVYPEYNGYVSISGVPDSMSLGLSDKNGEHKLTLPTARGGMIQWDASDGQRRVAPGKYNIIEENSGRSVGEIVVY